MKIKSLFLALMTAFMLLSDLTAAFAGNAASIADYQRKRRDHYCEFFNNPTDNAGQSFCPDNKPGKIPGGDIDAMKLLLKPTINMGDANEFAAVMGLVRNAMKSQIEVRIPDNLIGKPETYEWTLRYRQIKAARAVVEKFLTDMISARQAVPPAPAEQLAMVNPTPNPVEPPPAFNGAAEIAAGNGPVKPIPPTALKTPGGVLEGCSITDLPGFIKMIAGSVQAWQSAVACREAGCDSSIRSKDNFLGLQFYEGSLTDLECVVKDCCVSNNNFGADPDPNSPACTSLPAGGKCRKGLFDNAYKQRKEAGLFGPRSPYNVEILTRGERWISPCRKGSDLIKSIKGVNSSEDFLHCPKLQIAMLSYLRLGQGAPAPYTGKNSSRNFIGGNATVERKGVRVSLPLPKQSCIMIDGIGPITLSGIRSFAHSEGTGGAQILLTALEPIPGKPGNYRSTYENHQKANDGTCHFIKTADLGKINSPSGVTCQYNPVDEITGTFTLKPGLSVNPNWDLTKHPATRRRNNRDLQGPADIRGKEHSGFLTDPDVEPDPTCGTAVARRAVEKIVIDDKPYAKHDVIPPADAPEGMAGREQVGELNAPVSQTEPLGPIKPVAEVIHEIQKQAGIPLEQMANDPSFYEILMTMSKIRFQDPNYYVNASASEASLDKAIADVMAMQVILGREIRGQMERTAALKGTEVSLQYAMMPDSAKGTGGRTGALKTSPAQLAQADAAPAADFKAQYSEVADLIQGKVSKAKK